MTNRWIDPEPFRGAWLVRDDHGNLTSPRFTHWKPGFVMFHEPRSREQYEAEVGAV